MKNILLIGAGRSASSLIKYLLYNSQKHNWKITVADISVESAEQKVKNHPHARAIAFDVHDEQQRMKEIEDADIVVSLLPASLHYIVAKDCVYLRKHLVTASYICKEIKALEKEAEKNGVLLLNEIGLDPGIDHLSAMQIIDEIKEEGGEIISFKSYTGGLVAPECNDNPWGYKFTWNPRNVVLAGQGTAQYIEDGKYKYVPYSRLFEQTEVVKIKGHGSFEGYPNRDSLSYRNVYGLENIQTMLRGTLRMPDYCKAWNAFVQLGWTDDAYKIVDVNKLTYGKLLEAYLPKGKQTTKQKLAEFLGERKDSEVMKKLEWLGILEEKKIPLADASPAQVLQDLLEKKWKLKTKDIDMIVMQHQFLYKEREKNGNGRVRKIISSLVVKGEDATYTAMAKTVGLPVGIAVKLILNGQLKLIGVKIPTLKEIYVPVLEELGNYGIRFSEEREK